MNNELNIILSLGLEPVDRIIVPKSDFDLIQHFAIYLGSDVYGNHYISENVIGKGVVLTRVNDFFSSNPKITRIEKFEGTAKQRRVIVDRALTKICAPYSLISYNCEHYVNDLCTGELLSRQMNIAAILLGLLILIGIIHE